MEPGQDEAPGAGQPGASVRARSGGDRPLYEDRWAIPADWSPGQPREPLRRPVLMATVKPNYTLVRNN
jgi:hypothetical protein